MNEPHVEKFETTLPVKLTDQRALKFARDLSDRLTEMLDLRDDAKDVAARMKDQVKSLEVQVGSLNRIVRTGIINEPVPCSRMYDYERAEVVETRDDTGEIVNIRAMSPAERQKALPLKDDKGQPVAVADSGKDAAAGDH